MQGTEILDLLKSDQLEQEFIKKMKEQERLAIRAVLISKEAQIRDVGAVLNDYLTKAADELKGYATNAASNIKGALEGEAGSAADTYLTTTMQKPTLENPIKS